MVFSKSKIISAKYLSRLIKESAANSELRFCFILGSGASVESGIPSGSTLEMQWMDCLMGRSEDRGMPAMDEDETRRLASALYEEKKIKHKFDEIEKSWQDAKNEGKAISSEYYFDIYKLRFHAKLREGYSYLEKIMEHCDPSLGYHTLAKLLTESNQNNLVITTNFDSLVEDALFLYTDKKPLVVSHESLVDYMDENIQRPIVAKVHRGLMYEPFNSPETTNELRSEWQTALRHALNTYTPIVIGYAGGDHSLMSFLEDDHTDMNKSIYWCYYGSDLPEEKIQKLVKKRNGFFVSIDGFDALMVEIGKTMYGDAIRPSITAKHLEGNYDKRIKKYQQQWEKLNKKPKMQKALQKMNKAEQREEEQREKEQTLTAWDHIRRGNRAYDEGRQQDAVDEYSKAIELDSNYENAYNNRGIAYRKLGEYEKAIKDYDKAIELDPYCASAYCNRGIVYRKLGEYEKAIKDYDKAIELDPYYKNAYNNRGIAYRKLGEYEKAIKDYDKTIEWGTHLITYDSCDFAYKKLEEYEKTIKDYDKAIELDPYCVSAYFHRGIIYVDLGEYEKAIKDYDKAIELDSNNANAYYHRGIAYRKLGEYEKAIKDYDKAIKLDSSHGYAYFNHCARIRI